MAATKYIPDQCTLDDIAKCDPNITAAARVVSVWNQRHFTLKDYDRRALWNYMHNGAWRRKGQELSGNGIEGWKFWRDFRDKKTEELDYDKCTIARWLLLIAVNKGLDGVSQDVRDVIRERYGEQAITVFAGPVPTDRKITPVHCLWNENLVKEENNDSKNMAIQKVLQGSKKYMVKIRHKDIPPEVSSSKAPSLPRKASVKPMSTPKASSGVKVEPHATASPVTQFNQTSPLLSSNVPKKRKRAAEETAVKLSRSERKGIFDFFCG